MSKKASSQSPAQNEPADNNAPAVGTERAEAQGTSKAFTPKKGKATPKRKEAQAHPGTFASRYQPAESFGDARKRRKELKASMTKEEYKAYKAEIKAAKRERTRQAQAAMDRGEEQYLLPRDKGPERAFIRDFVDSKRYVNNIVMPVAIALLFVMLIGQWAPTFASIVSSIAMVLILIFAIEGIMLGRAASRATREKFPNTSERGFSMGFYAYGRATQPRRWRTPKPRVEIGQKVA